MRFLVQWARANPTDWEEVDSQQWKHTPKKQLGAAVDDAGGFVACLNIQGLLFNAQDHFAVEHVDDETIRITAWVDSGPPDERQASVWTIKTLRPDPTMNGAINTSQVQVRYADPSKIAWLKSIGHNDVRPWSEFAPPADTHVRHGRQLPDALWEKHTKKLTPRGWRSFTEGLHPSELVNGVVPGQRALGRYVKPDGTRTYYGSDTALASGIHTCDQEVAFLTSTSTTNTIQASLTKSSDETAFCFTSPSNEPDSADWPAATAGAPYRCFIDCAAVGADITYGCLTLGGSAGHFARVDSGLTSDLETQAQSEGAFSGTGVKTASHTSWNPSSGSATDRWEVLIAAANASSNMTQTIDLNVNAGASDTYTDGPWPAAILTATASDTASVSDSASRAATWLRPLEETAVVSDQVVAGRQVLRATDPDAVSVADQVEAICYCVFDINASDTVEASDATSRAHDARRDIEETAAVVADQVSRSAEYGALATDTVGVSDSVDGTLIAGGTTYERSANETAVVSDAAVAELQAERTIGESMVVADAVAKTLALGRDAADTAVVSDQAVRYTEAIRSLEETVSVSDQAAGDIVVERSAADSLLVSDQAARQHDAIRALEESAVVAEQTATTLDYGRTATDTAVVSDSVETTLEAELARTASDTVVVADQALRDASYVRAPADSTVVTDQAVVAGDSDVSASDSVSVSDTPSRSATFDRTIDDWRGTST